MNVSDSSAAPDWWQASDGKWYSPESHPNAAPAISTIPSVPETAEDTTRKPRWQRWWAVVLVVVLALFVVRATANFAEDDPASRNEPVSPKEAAAAAAPESAAPSPAETESAQSAPDVEVETSQACSYLGVGDSGFMLVSLEFDSPLATQADLLVKYGLFDSTGDRFDTANKVVNSALPSERMRVDSDTLDDLPESLAEHVGITCQITEIMQLDFGETPQRPGAGDTCEVLGINDFGSLQLEFTITSPFSALADNVFVPYSLSVAGVRFDDALHSIQDLGPGETVMSKVDTIIKPPDWATETPTCQILEIDDL